MLTYKMNCLLIPYTCLHKLLIITDGSVHLDRNTDNETVRLSNYKVSVLKVAAVLNFTFSVITTGIAVI